MSTKLLNSKDDPRIDPVGYFRKYYAAHPPACRFVAKTLAETKKWQKKTASFFSPTVPLIQMRFGRDGDLCPDEFVLRQLNGVPVP